MLFIVSYLTNKTQGYKMKQDLNDLLNQEIDNCMKEGHSIECGKDYLVWLGLKDVCIATAGERKIGLSYDVAGFDVESFRTYEDYLLLTVKQPKVEEPKEKARFSDVILTMNILHEKELDIIHKLHDAGMPIEKIQEIVDEKLQSFSDTYDGLVEIIELIEAVKKHNG